MPVCYQVEFKTTKDTTEQTIENVEDHAIEENHLLLEKGNRTILLPYSNLVIATITSIKS